MISIPSEQELNTLRAFHEPQSLTLYAAFMEPNGPDNPLRIEVKNLLRDARAQLQAAGATERHIAATLQPIEDQMERGELWPTRHEALVFFSHPHVFRSYHVPDTDEPHKVIVADGFHLDVLEAVLQASQPYFVLMLDHKNTQLYEGDRYQLRPVALEGFPHDMVAALGIDEYPESRQTHSVGPVALGKQSGGFHEQYNRREVDKSLLKEFFRRVDAALHPFLRKHPYPLILAGVEYVVALYRAVNTYPRVTADVIAGNLADVSLDTIREHAVVAIDKGVNRI